MTLCELAAEVRSEIVTSPHCLLCGRRMDSCSGPGDEHWWECFPYDEGDGTGRGCGYSTPRVPRSDPRPLTWKIEPDWLKRMRDKIGGDGAP